MKVIDDRGDELDATFSVEVLDGTPTVLFESRGGTAGTPSARNVDYNRALAALLLRLGAVCARLVDAAVESGVTTNLPVSARRVIIDGRPYPVELSRVDDFDALRKAIGRGQAAVGQAAGATGGNMTKRVRLYLDVPAPIAELTRRSSGAFQRTAAVVR